MRREWRAREFGWRPARRSAPWLALLVQALVPTYAMAALGTTVPAAHAAIDAQHRAECTERHADDATPVSDCLHGRRCDFCLVGKAALLPSATPHVATAPPLDAAKFPSADETPAVRRRRGRPCCRAPPGAERI